MTTALFALLLAAIPGSSIVAIATLVGAWVTAHAPLIIGALPTVIVGLSSSPKTEGWAQYLKTFLKFFSIVTHKDESGTFQLPFGLQVVLSRRSEAGAAAPGAGADAGSPAAVAAASQPGAPSSSSPLSTVTGAILGFFFVASMASCAGWTTAQKAAVGRGLLDCTVNSVADSAIKVLPAVSTVIKGGTVNWQDQMTELGLGFGFEAVMCAAKQVMASLATTPEALRASPAFIKESEAAQGRVIIFLKAKGLTPEQVKEPWPTGAPPTLAPAPPAAPPSPSPTPAAPPTPVTAPAPAVVGSLKKFDCGAKEVLAGGPEPWSPGDSFGLRNLDWLAAIQ